MPEPSGDTPKPPPPTPPELTGKNLTVAPRVNPPSVFNQKGAPPAELPTAMAEFVEWMSKLAGGSVPPEEVAPTGRALIPKEQKKFSRQPADGGTAVHGAPGAASAAGSVAARDALFGHPTAPSAETPGRSAPPESFNVERKRRTKEQLSRSPAVVLSVQFLVFALIVGSFFLGRATVSKTGGSSSAAESGTSANSPNNKTPEILSTDLAAKVDQANAAEKDGDYSRARSLLEEVRQAGGHLAALDYHLALLAFESGDQPRALLLLNSSADQEKDVAEAYNLRGIMMEQAAGLSKGLPDLERAAQADPFNAKYAFFVGEVLRRTGKPQAAEDYLTQALHRLREPGLQGTYEAKLRLAQLEAGQEKAFSDEMALKLALNPPPVDWLFTAAAVELHHGNAAAAAGYLDKARAATSREEMEARLRDYYFSSFANDKELARFFHRVDQPAASPVLPKLPPSVPGDAPASDASAAGQGKAP